MRKKLYFVLVSFFLVSGSLFAQQRNCATMEVLERKLQKDPGMAQRMAQIEAHTQNYIQNAPNLSVNAEVLYVPIVVHVVWNSANSVENISDAQIMSQVDVIYKDFRRLNEDADDTWSQAADMEIEFYLAQVDPDGNPTTGITRTETTVSSWGTDDSIKFSSSGGVDAWDPTRYFNFWVGNIGGGILGYSSFPTSAGQPDDGIVMSPQYFGSSDYEAAAGETFYLSAPYDKGRTTTHEMGHYFNLFHIWGDDSGACSGSDLVDDTPNQANSTFGCPSGVQTDGCATVDPGYMYQNYMDYTDDACMIMFTEGQKGRMRATLEAGGPREVLNQAPFDYTMALSASVLDVCAPADAVYDFTYLTFDGFSDNTDFSASGLPAGAAAVFSPSSATANGTAVTLTVSGLGGVPVGSYNFTIDGTSGTTVNSSNATLNVFDTNYATLSLTAPADGAMDADADFEWTTDPNAASYDIEIASDAGFTTIISSTNVSSPEYSGSGLLPLTQYWWRVRSVNDCGTGAYSSATFTTADITCDVFNSTDTPVGIPDNNGDGINSVLNIATTSLISDVNVTVNITHTWVNDLILTLTSPNGTSVLLSNRNGAAATQNYTDTVFDQEATDPISSGSAPFTGSFQPDGDLSVLYGEISFGDWTLNVSDNAFLDSGTIDSWSLEICGTIQPDNDSDGVPNASDNCPDTANFDQADLDSDGIGDVCDDDLDGDGVLNGDDNCPETANADQADADGDGFGDLCDIECDFFTSNDTPIDISASEGGTYTAVINIQDDLPIDDVNVRISIDHTWAEDLDIFLQSPGGTLVELSTFNGGSGDNYTDTVFDDDGATPITGGSAPFTGTFQPEGSLSDFTGESSLGDWTLLVTDTFGPLDGGEMLLFELELCVVGEFTPDEDGDGVIDSVDNCVDIANADQSDIDGDGFGDVCDDDIDGDGIANAEDNCPENANPGQGDLDGDGIGDFCDVECEISTSEDTPLEISDGAGATYSVSTTIMTPLASVTDVNVTVSIEHTWVSDLTLVLRSPNGTEVELTSGNGGSGDNYTNTVFDQDAEDPITAGSPPFTGSFIPEGDLTDFNDEGAVGTWTLIVTDAFFLDGGFINIFKLEVCGIRDPFDYDADGVTNDLDNCVFTANSDQADADNDGSGDICDDDDDNDGIPDTSDNCQFIANADQADLDMDGIGDPCDTDVDGDGMSNDYDNCPDTYNPDQADLDNDGIGDLCDEVLASDVLSPNGDGINDTWMIVNIERYPNASVKVYNRWGNEVFSATGYSNDWRGTNGTGGNQLPAGSYFYQIDQYGNGEVVVTGWIYITF